METLQSCNFKQDLKFYFLNVKPNEVGTTCKHPKRINGNVKNLSKNGINITLNYIALVEP